MVSTTTTPFYSCLLWTATFPCTTWQPHLPHTLPAATPASVLFMPYSAMGSPHTAHYFHAPRHSSMHTYTDHTPPAHILYTQPHHTCIHHHLHYHTVLSMPPVTSTAATYHYLHLPGSFLPYHSMPIPTFCLMPAIHCLLHTVPHCPHGRSYRQLFLHTFFHFHCHLTTWFLTHHLLDHTPTVHAPAFPHCLATPTWPGILLQPTFHMQLPSLPPLLWPPFYLFPFYLPCHSRTTPPSLCMPSSYTSLHISSFCPPPFHSDSYHFVPISSYLLFSHGLPYHSSCPSRPDTYHCTTDWVHTYLGHTTHCISTPPCLYIYRKWFTTPLHHHYHGLPTVFPPHTTFLDFCAWWAHTATTHAVPHTHHHHLPTTNSSAPCILLACSYLLPAGYLIPVHFVLPGCLPHHCWEVESSAAYLHSMHGHYLFCYLLHCLFSWNSIFTLPLGEWDYYYLPPPTFTTVSHSMGEAFYICPMDPYLFTQPPPPPQSYTPPWEATMPACPALHARPVCRIWPCSTYGIMGHGIHSHTTC